MACDIRNNIKSTRHKGNKLHYSVKSYGHPLHITENQPPIIAAKFVCAGDAFTYAMSLSKAPLSALVVIED